MSNRANNIKNVAIFLTVFAVSLLLFKYVFIISYVPTKSMEPTIKAQTLCFGTRINPDGYENEDIVIFRKDGKLLIKRIVACGGETYKCEGKTYEVPEGSFFLRGDNADNSNDSRYWEDPFVKEEDVIAKVHFYFKGVR